MKSESDGFQTKVVLVVIIFCIAIFGTYGRHRGETDVREEAVLKGHAEWVADQSGKPQFKWKEVKP